MRAISILAAFALTGSAVAGPLHGKHGKLHHRDGRKHPGFHYIHANTTTSALGTGTGVDVNLPTSSVVEPYPADPSIPAPVAPTTSVSGSAVVVPASECDASPDNIVEGVATETQTKTITSTLTYTTTDGPSTYVTTSTKAETIKIIVKYTTIVVPGPNSPAPTSPPTNGGNGGSLPDDGTVAVGGESVPSTPIKNGNGSGGGSENESGNFPGNYPGYDSDSGTESTPGSEGGSDNGSGTDPGSDSDDGDDGEDDSGSPATSIKVPPYPTNLPTYPNNTASFNGSYPVTPGLNFASRPKKTKATKKTKKTKTTTKSKKRKTTTTKRAIKTTAVHTTSTKRRNPKPSTSGIVDPVKTSSLTTSTKTSASTTRSTSSAVDGVAPPNQTGANTVKGCQKWYTPVSGDWCSKVADANGITVSDFITWNPSVGSDCTTMYVGWSYCVAIKIGDAADLPSQRPSTTIVTTTRPTTAADPTTTSAVTTAVTTSRPVTTQATTTTSAAPIGVPTPSPIREGVTGCTKWDLVVSFDTCDVFASRNGVSTSSVIALNPSVGSDCGGLWLGYYFCVSTSPAGSSPTTSTRPASTTPHPSSTSNPNTGAYIVYRGSGTVADGWPASGAWLDFDTMWNANLPNIGTNCAWMTDPSGAPVVANTQQETADLRSAIIKVADANNLPRSFVLAIVQQESNGCVRVHTTFNPVRNPGLMQTHNGAGTCNDKSQSLYLLSPQCTASRIEQMVVDGVSGTTDGDGLVQTVVKSGYASGEVARFYAGARLYNGGEAGGNWNRQDLSISAGTRCYASDVANRLTGWAQGESGCENALKAGTL